MNKRFRAIRCGPQMLLGPMFLCKQQLKEAEIASYVKIKIQPNANTFA